MSSGQEAPKTASLSLTVLRVHHYCKFTDSSVRMFDQTQCPMAMLLYFLLYGCTWKKKKKKKKKKNGYPIGNRVLGAYGEAGVGSEVKNVDLISKVHYITLYLTCSSIQSLHGT